MGQIFIGEDTLVSDIYSMQSSKQFVHISEDNIRFRGAVSKLTILFLNNKLEISELAGWKIRYISSC